MSIGDSFEELEADVFDPGTVDDPQTYALDVRDLVGADRHLRQLRRLAREARNDEMVVRAEIERLNEWLADREDAREETASWHREVLERFARACYARDQHVKTITLPNGELTLRAQQPEWSWEEEAFLEWAEEHLPELVVRPAPTVPPPRIDKVAAKKALTVLVGEGRRRQVAGYGIAEGGDIVLPPGVKVTERESKFDLELHGEAL